VAVVRTVQNCCYF